MITRRFAILGGIAMATSGGRVSVPNAFRDVFASGLTADQALDRLMPAVVETLGTDRCFIYMRDPVKRRTAYTHGHSALPDWRSFDGGGWSREPNPETYGEPMLKKAFSDPTALFIADIETAPPTVLNAGLERGFFGHRALVHAPVYHNGTFYGILETAVRDSPRIWTKFDRDVITWLQPRTARLAAAYLGHI